jgi:hypothetical protein
VGRVDCVRRARSPSLKASIPIFVVAGVAGVWLGLVLFVLRAFGIHVV